MDTQQFDIDNLGRERFVRLAGLTGEDHGLVRELQREVIAPEAASIVDSFYGCLRTEPEFGAVLPTNGARIDDLKMTYRRYLLSFGVDFASADYFRDRLRIGAIHASLGVPLSLYLAAGRLLQQLIIDRVLVHPRDDRPGRTMVDLVLKLTTLDTSLVIEAYHGARVGALKNSIAALRTRGENLVQALSTDALTGVASRRRVLETLRSTLDHSHRQAHWAGVILLDLDHFKQINDRHGHRTGDKVLEVAAARIRSSLRPVDTVGRYGGDEFLIILPGGEPATSLRIAERVRRSLSSDLVHGNGVTVRVTASQGVVVSDGSEKPVAVIERADEALYTAKRAGRDQIVSAGDCLADLPGAALRARGR
jgi:diguanylate cyclase (GGDEF)-like protein